MNDWQPISTAPKDGGSILGTVINDHVREFGIQQVDVIRWQAWPQPQLDGALGDWEPLNYEPMDDHTHWMPLPAPPAMIDTISDPARNQPTA